MMRFEKAFEILIGHEGGYVNDPRDPGGETKYGISKRAFPSIDIKNLTLDKARAIYRTEYWIPAKCDQLPDVIRFDMFDAAVNSGIKQASKWLQRAAGVADDGIIGAITLQAVNAHDPQGLVCRFNGVRLRFMTDLGTWDRFGKGWARRIAFNLTREEVR